MGNWQKSPSPPSGQTGKFFLDSIYPFHAISSNFSSAGRKASPPGWGKIFLHWIYPFQAISSNFVFVAEKLHWIYPFQAISSNFGFCGRKAPPPPPPPMRTSTAQGLPPVTKDYLLGTVTHLVVNIARLDTFQSFACFVLGMFWQCQRRIRWLWTICNWCLFCCNHFTSKSSFKNLLNVKFKFLILTTKNLSYPEFFLFQILMALCATIVLYSLSEKESAYV